MSWYWSENWDIIDSRLTKLTKLVYRLFQKSPQTNDKIQAVHDRLSQILGQSPVNFDNTISIRKSTKLHQRNHWWNTPNQPISSSRNRLPLSETIQFASQAVSRPGKTPRTTVGIRVWAYRPYHRLEVHWWHSALDQMYWSYFWSHKIVGCRHCF